MMIVMMMIMIEIMYDFDDEVDRDDDSDDTSKDHYMLRRNYYWLQAFMRSWRQFINLVTQSFLEFNWLANSYATITTDYTCTITSTITTTTTSTAAIVIGSFDVGTGTITQWMQYLPMNSINVNLYAMDG